MVRNINSDNTIGIAVRLVQREDMDSMSPDWHAASGTVVREYMFDSRSPKHFYIYPCVPVGKKLEIEYSSHVNEVTLSNIKDPLQVCRAGIAIATIARQQYI